MANRMSRSAGFKWIQPLQALQGAALRTQLPVCLRWQHSTPELRQQSDAAMVARGQLDVALLQLAAARGGT